MAKKKYQNDEQKQREFVNKVESVYEKHEDDLLNGLKTIKEDDEAEQQAAPKVRERRQTFKANLEQDLNQLLDFQYQLFKESEIES